MPVNKDEIDQLQSDRTFTCHEIESLFNVINNGADGNCLFYSVSQQMVGNQSKAKEYRQMVCDFYKTFNTNRQYPSDSLEEKIQMSLIGEESHKDQVCKNLDWAQSPDIYVLVKLLNIRIIIFNFLRDRVTATPYTAHPTAKNERTLYIKFNGTDHYEALNPKSLPKPAANVTRKISPKNSSLKPLPKPDANVTRKISPKPASRDSEPDDSEPDDSAYLNHRFKLKNGREGVIVHNDAKNKEYNQTLLFDFDDGKKNPIMDVASTSRINAMVYMNSIEILSKVSEPSPKKPSPKKPSPKKPSPKSASRDSAPDDSAYLNHRFKMKNGREGVIVRNDAKNIENNQTLFLSFDDDKTPKSKAISAGNIYAMVQCNNIDILSKVSESSPKKPSPKKPSPKKPSPKKPSPKKPSPKKPSPSSNTTRKNSPKVGEGSLVGKTIYKEFNGDVYRGTVVSYDKPYYRIVYEADGDKEEMTTNEVKKLMVPLIYR